MRHIPDALECFAEEGQNGWNSWRVRNQVFLNDHLPTLVEARPEVFSVSVPVCKCGRRANSECVNCKEPVCAAHSYTPEGHNQPNPREALCATCCELMQHEAYLEQAGGRVEVR